jgi:metal-responsive CopG/Arc/MetJ family transcriptional regulator
MKQKISVSLSTRLIEKIDIARGIVHRSTYLESLLNNINMPSLPSKITEGMASHNMEASNEHNTAC